MVDEKSVMAVTRAARPSFRNANDKVAFAVHAAFVASGYVLHATGTPAFSDNALSSSSTDEVGIDHWNQSEDDYAFVYSSPENSKKVLVKCLAMNDKLLVDALSEGASEPLHLEINVKDFVMENEGTNYGSLYKNFDKLVGLIDKELLSKLNGTKKEGSSSQTSSSRTRDREAPEPEIPPPYPAGSRMPDWQTNDSQPYPAGLVYPPVPVNPVGGSDLYPGPGAGMYPTRGDFGVGGGGGMFVGPDHPMFSGIGRGRDPGLPGGLPGVPPGARFDPYGPPNVPGFEPNRFTRNPTI